jgi:hypothetical protein
MAQLKVEPAGLVGVVAHQTESVPGDKRSHFVRTFEGLLFLQIISVYYGVSRALERGANTVIVEKSRAFGWLSTSSGCQRNL